VIARRSVWSDPAVQQLAERFVTVADEVGRLQSGNDPECELFQKIAEQGHYGGRTRPTRTRQGTYATTPSGQLLASINSNDARAMTRMLRQALERWEQISSEQRQLSEDPEARQAAVRRAERRYPDGGLVLHVNSRDLPRDDRPDDWRGQAWNQDYAWFRSDEARGFLPEQPKVGDRHEVPAPLVRRLARCHLIDNVRGQTSPYRDGDIERAELAATVTAVEGDVVSLHLEGRTRTVAEGRWSIAGFRDMDSPSQQQRGYEARLLGRARFDLQSGRFEEFELVAHGTRWGGTQYNGRADDLQPAPLGIAFLLAGDSPAERVAPAFLYAYGW
jgi:hypothetical protein